MSYVVTPLSEYNAILRRYGTTTPVVNDSMNKGPAAGEIHTGSRRSKCEKGYTSDLSRRGRRISELAPIPATPQPLDIITLDLPHILGPAHRMKHPLSRAMDGETLLPQVEINPDGSLLIGSQHLCPN